MTLKAKLLITTLALFVFLQVNAQTNSTDELSDFKIIIENTSNGIAMKSLKGSAWIDLSFSLKKEANQAVDEYGMTELGNASENKDENLSDFLFTVAKTEVGVQLKGIEGTAWTDLSFTLRKGDKQAIDQFGMTSLN